MESSMKNNFFNLLGVYFLSFLIVYAIGSINVTEHGEDFFHWDSTKKVLLFTIPTFITFMSFVYNLSYKKITGIVHDFNGSLVIKSKQLTLNDVDKEVEFYIEK